MSFTRYIKTLTAAAVLTTALSGSASALTCGGIGYSLFQDGMAVTGVCGTTNNDFPSNVNTVSPISPLIWVVADKSDNATRGTLAKFGSPVPVSGQTNWSILNPNGYKSLLITLKQASSYAAFVLDFTKPLNGTWSTTGPGSSSNIISHSSVFVAGPPTAVPLPGAGLLLAGVFAGFAVMSRRKARA